ncbi:succinate dehydrogenase cytochrome b subunit [Rothia nasisuis]|uniref:succinate dehydrogenase cytochrome b subunit n=1 Tax=Rothia nasisuis TaxID=2109647 RepID=UPI001F26CB18|nr:succinate dehydrogenase cytochrome b subunit [Rothia nasisuis]
MATTVAPAPESTQPSKPPRVSNVLAKYIMAVTGVIFALFVLVHMYGNLKVYMGPEAFNHYALFLRTLFEPLFPYEGFLWVFRIVLLLCLIGHVGCAVLLSSRARKARGKYKRRGLRGYRSFTARTMPVTGLVLLLFIIFHILDLTAGVAVAPESFHHGSPAASFAYENLIASFQRPAVAFFYMAAMVILFLHLAHGLWAAVHDFGVTVGEKARSWLILIAGLYGLVVMLGNITIPIAVLTGILD